MTIHQQVNSQGPLRDMRWLAWRNDSSETCPAGGLVRVTGSVYKGRQLIRTGNKPNADSQAGLYVNHYLPVGAGGYGLITRESPCIVAYQTGSPTNGQIWGAKNAEWKLHTGYRGWLIDGTAVAAQTLVPAQRVQARLSGEAFYFWLGGSTSSDTSVSSTETTVNIPDKYDEENPGGTIFTLSSSELTINDNGMYLMGWSGNFTLSGVVPLYVWLEKNTGAGFNKVSLTYRGHTNVGAGDDDYYSMTHPVNVASGNVFRLRCKTVGSATGTIYSESSISDGGNSFYAIKQNWHPLTP